MFSFFRTENARKTRKYPDEKPDAPLLQYFGARMVTVASDALPGALSAPCSPPNEGCSTRLQKIAHSPFSTPNPRTNERRYPCQAEQLQAWFRYAHNHPFEESYPDYNRPNK